MTDTSATSSATSPAAPPTPSLTRSGRATITAAPVPAAAPGIEPAGFVHEPTTLDEPVDEAVERELGRAITALRAQLTQDRPFPVGPTQATPRRTNGELLDAARARLRDSPTGRALLARAERDGLRIDVADDAVYDTTNPAGSGGTYLAEEHRVYLKRSSVEDPDTGALLLGHELQHYVFDATDIAALVAISSEVMAVGGFVGALLTGDDPDRGARQGSKEVLSYPTETSAFQAQRTIAYELGIQDFGLGTAPDGHARTRGEIVEVLRRHPLYGGS